ncbi:MAG TPA: hypothetical protein VGA08_02660 [Candidatus Saccharimonadales bacterium]
MLSPVASFENYPLTSEPIAIERDSFDNGLNILKNAAAVHQDAYTKTNELLDEVLLGGVVTDATKTGIEQYLKSQTDLAALESIPVTAKDESLAVRNEYLSRSPRQLQDLIEMAWQAKQEATIEMTSVNLNQDKNRRISRHLINQALFQQTLEEYKDKYRLNTKDISIIEHLRDLADDDLEHAWYSLSPAVSLQRAVEDKRQMVPKKAPHPDNGIRPAAGQKPAAQTPETVDQNAVLLSVVNEARVKAQRILFGLNKKLELDDIRDLIGRYKRMDEPRANWIVDGLAEDIQRSASDAQDAQSIINQRVELKVGQLIYGNRKSFLIPWRIFSVKLDIPELQLLETLDDANVKPTNNQLAELGKFARITFNKLDQRKHKHRV